MLQLIPKIPAYKVFRQFGFPALLPLNLTVSLTYKCNSRCKTCNIYRKDVPEFSKEEFEKTFHSLGRSPYWLTLSGGEPFLRKDIVEICKSAYRNCRPRIINIPTNGILCDVIPERVKQIAMNSPDTQIIINLSLDEIGEKHDEIRNVKGNFTRASKTFQRLNIRMFFRIPGFKILKPITEFIQLGSFRLDLFRGGQSFCLRFFYLDHKFLPN